MQGYKLEILAPAWAEIEEIADYHLMMVGPVSAKNITDKILLTLQRLKMYLLSGVSVLDPELNVLGYRVVVCGQYVCIYRLILETVVVYHIVHGSKEYSRLLKIQDPKGFEKQ